VPALHLLAFAAERLGDRHSADSALQRAAVLLEKPSPQYAPARVCTLGALTRASAHSDENVANRKGGVWARGDRNRSLNDGRIPNVRVVRAHASTGYNPVEANRRASRNGLVSEIPIVTIRNFSHGAGSTRRRARRTTSGRCRNGRSWAIP
jgi:hypothetical protein